MYSATRCLAALVLILAIPRAGADDEAAASARLREQLRQAVTRTRQLQDENTALKIELARAVQQAPATAVADPAELEQLRGSLAEAERTAAGLRAQVEQDRTVLAQWQQAHERAVAAARERDEAARGLDARLRTVEAAQRSCLAGNARLVEISEELLERYRSKGVLAAMRTSEPLLGLQRVELERLAQEYHHAITDATQEPGPVVGGSPAATGQAPVQPQ